MKRTLVGMPAPYLAESPFDLIRRAPPRMTPYPFPVPVPRKQRPALRIETVIIPRPKESSVYPQLWAAMLICWAIAMVAMLSGCGEHNPFFPPKGSCKFASPVTAVSCGTWSGAPYCFACTADGACRSFLVSECSQ